MQSIQYQNFPNTLDELIKNVKDAYDELDPTINKYTWLTLQSCMVDILKDKGGNNYKIPLMGKRRLERDGVLPSNIEVSDEVIQEAVNYLNERLVPTGEPHGDNEFEVDAD